jgi:hypothetical protein
LHGWLVPILALCLACSEERVHSGSVPESADFLPMVGDSVESASSSVLDRPTGEEPRLVLRCENGHVAAYVFLEPPNYRDSGFIDPPGVAVRLDSAPAC